MDARLAGIGASIIAASLVLGLYGLFTSSGQALGVAFSGGVLGAVVLAVGFSYQEPLALALEYYGRGLHSALLRIHEDLGLTGASVIQACRRSEGVYVVFSRRPVECSGGLAPGLGVEKDTAYLALLFPAGEELADLESLASSFGVARSISVSRTGKDTIVVEAIRPNPSLLENGWAPLNPVQLLLVAGTAAVYGRIRVERQDYSSDAYRLVVRVV